MEKLLSKTKLFYNIPESNIAALLKNLKAQEKTFKKNNVVLHAGNVTESLGIVLSGTVVIEYSDVWGNNSVLGRAAAGEVFAEIYASLPAQPLPVTVKATDDTVVLFIKVKRIFEYCDDINDLQLLKNLLEICAKKTLQLSRRAIHTTYKTIRGRLMSYFSDVVKSQQKYTFDVSFNRQQLADYLGVDRSALCNELSKMQKDGIIRYKHNRFEIINPSAVD